MNSGNLSYHCGVMSWFPDIVAEYLECGPGTKNDLVKLKVAVTQSDAEGKVDDGTLSTIIRYKTPYFINSHRFILSFSLGKTLSLCTILGIPSLEVMHGVLDLCGKTLSIKRLGITLPLVMTEPCLCFPTTDDVNLQSGSLLTASTPPDDHYIVANGDASKFLTYPSQSDALVVTDSWENNIFSRSVTNSTNKNSMWPIAHCTFTTASSCLRSFCAEFKQVAVHSRGTNIDNNANQQPSSIRIRCYLVKGSGYNNNKNKKGDNHGSSSTMGMTMQQHHKQHTQQQQQHPHQHPHQHQQ